MTALRLTSLCALLLFFPVSATSRARVESTSAPAARKLTELMRQQKFETFAAANPEDPGRFTAAHRAGSLLLVISAKHPSVAGIQSRLDARQYYEVYLDLHATPTSRGKFFVQDSSADGLHFGDDAPGGADVIYEDGELRLMLGTKESERKTKVAEFQAVDRRYAQVLEVLAGAASNRGSSAGSP